AAGPVRASIAAAAALAALGLAGSFVQLGIIAAGLAAGALLLRPSGPFGGAALPIRIGRRTGAAALAAFFLLLVGLPALASASGEHGLDLFARFYRVGALVFGG